MSVNPLWARHATALISPGGPAVTPEAAQAYAADLHRAAADALPLVAEITGLPAEAARAGQVPVIVVDRPGWAQAVAQQLAAMQELAGEKVPGLSSASVALGAAVLARMILGQFDPYWGTDGRLILTAPNIAQFRQQYDLDQRDLCLWVCVHELTHAVQYQTAPWINEFIVSKFTQVLAEIEGTQSDSFFTTGAMGELNAVMSVLEGHAQYAMNSVSVALMPGKQRIIAAMERKRNEKKLLQCKLAQLLSLDKKAAQYNEGEKFTRAVISEVGLAGFNRVWHDTESMPTFAELKNPQQWIKRMNLGHPEQSLECPEVVEQKS